MREGGGSVRSVQIAVCWFRSAAWLLAAQELGVYRCSVDHAGGEIVEVREMNRLGMRLGWIYGGWKGEVWL
jgi:hypothetical protein